MTCSVSFPTPSSSCSQKKTKISKPNAYHMRGVYIMWINCYASIYPKNAVGLYLHENRLDVRLCLLRFTSVARKWFFCLISYFLFFVFFLTDRESAPLETRRVRHIFLLLRFSGSNTGIILNGRALSHSERVKIMSVQRDTS
jgi:uncharacterized membrane protein YsdA (DUF1294 family)